MTRKPHELHDEFPEYAAVLNTLKDSDAHFARLVSAYDEANHAVCRAEADLEPTEDLAMIDMRKTRGALKNQIFAVLRAAQPTS